MKAINPKNQKQLDKAIKALIKYNELNDLRNEADGNGDEKLEKKLERLCEVSFDKYLELSGELPKGQIKAIEKSELY